MQGKSQVICIEPMILDIEETTPVRSWKAKGKRMTGIEIEHLKEIEPERYPEEPEEEDLHDDSVDIENPQEEEEKVDKNQVIDEITGQKRLF